MEVVTRVGAWIVGHPWQISTGMLALALGAVLVLDGGDPDLAPTTSTSTTARVTTTGGPSEPGGPVTTSTTAVPVGEGTNPFTGEQGVGGKLVVVKVDNAPAARPQIGLASAGLIIEVPVEGGITRFTAFYLGDAAPMVGPVRSLRPVDADLLAPFPGTVIATSGQPHVVGMVTSAGIALADPNTSGLLQALERPRPHHLFATLANAPLAIPLGTRAPWSYGAWTGGERASSVSLATGAELVEWRWEGDVWRRYSDGAPTEVMAALEEPSEPLARQVVIVLAANRKSGGYFDSAGAEVPDFDVVGGGELWILYDGQVAEGTWSRASQAQPWSFFDLGGDSLAVPVGSLFLAVVPAESTVTING